MKFLLAVLAGASLTALPVASSGAQESPPTPCTGVISPDPAGDDTVQPLAIPVSGDHSAVGENPNVDIRNVYINYRANAAGEKVLTGYLTLTNLSKAVPEDAPEDVTWWVEFDRFENGVTALKATSDGSEVTFYYGTQEEIIPGEANAPAEYTETTGQFIEGANGVVAIDLPAAAGLKAGDKLTGVFGMTTYSPSSTDAVRTFADRAPDDGATAEKTYTVTECPAAAPPSAAGPTPPPVQPPPPGTPPQQQPGQQQQQQQSGRVAPGLTFTVRPGRDARAPFRFRTVGRLVPPRGANVGDACQGRVSVQVKRGRRTVSNRRVQVRRNCTFSQTVKFGNRKRLGKSRRLRVIVTFQGNKVLLPQKARARSIRVR